MNIFNFPKITKKNIALLSIIFGILAICITFYTVNRNTKADTLHFLFSEEKENAKKENGIFADFITPHIYKYSGPISETMQTCIDGYDPELIKNIYSYEKLNIEDGSVNVQQEPNSSIHQTREQIKKELMPVFGHAVKNQEINWKWNEENKTYTFSTYEGDEALWYCYFRKETQFFVDFFNITQEEQIDPLPKITKYRVDSRYEDIDITWDYDYSTLYSALKDKDITFELQYKKTTEQDIPENWKKIENISYPEITFGNENSPYTWGEKIEYGPDYNIKIQAVTHYSWYKKSEPLEFIIKTNELEYASQIGHVRKKNEDISISLLKKITQKKEEGTFHPLLQQENGKAFVNIYTINENNTNTLFTTKNLEINEAEKNGEADSIKKTFTIDTAGVYSVVPCYGTDAMSCREYGIPTTVEILDFTCTPLFENHNDKNADRINIVFIGSRYQSLSDFIDIVKRSLTWDGNPVPISYFDEQLQQNRIYKLGWGLFSMEPLKSNKQKFNLWYVNEPMTTLTNSAENLCGLPFEYDAIYANRSFLGMLGRTRSFTYLANFNENRSKGNPYDMFFFSHNYMPYNNGTDDMRYTLFSHETSHALFGLNDEYAEGTGHDPRYGEVSCMENKTEAEKKWGNLLGQLDPFWHEIDAQLKKYNLDTYTYTEYEIDENGNTTEKTVTEETFPQSRFTIQYFEGGCMAEYGDSRVIKPTEESLMSRDYENPIYGLVNRKEVERVLNMFTGEPFEY